MIQPELQIKLDKMIQTAIVNDVMTAVFTIGLLIIYIPQFHKIIKQRTSKGFNMWFMFLGHTASLLSWINAMMFYINTWWGCHGSRQCVEGFFGFGLLVFQWILYLVMYILFVKYHPGRDLNQLNDPIPDKRVTIGFWVSNAIGLVAFIITLCLLGYGHNWHGDETGDLTGWSLSLTVITLIMFLLHYLPQIWETCRLGTVGSLSLVTLGMMTPGTFLWTLFLAFQKNDSNPDAGKPQIWVPYLIVGIMQAVLLAIGCYFERRAKRFKNKYSDIMSALTMDIDDEEQRLLIDDEGIRIDTEIEPVLININDP